VQKRVEGPCQVD